MFNFKTILVERNIECPMCEHLLKNGDIMYKDDYRGKTLCGYCKEDYKKEWDNK
ncbi:MAG: hypothetical protein PF488_04740 [Patescibacteria group bacterium]|jgi:transcription elongation factor Elf1|nr:hypothetical protein [Patescibacteria group bacterium]